MVCGCNIDHGGVDWRRSSLCAQRGGAARPPRNGNQCSLRFSGGGGALRVDVLNLRAGNAGDEVCANCADHVKQRAAEPRAAAKTSGCNGIIRAAGGTRPALVALRRGTALLARSLVADIFEM